MSITVNTPEKYSGADWLLLDMVRQHFTERGKPKYYDPCFIRANCDALYYLCTIGLLRPTPGSEDWDGYYRTFCARECEPRA